MITLNSDKGLVLIKTWEEVYGRPGFVEELDPKAIALDRIIGSYLFKEYIRCGLRTCRQPHGRGYLVATKDGRETNIGNHCGKKHFGVDFEALRKTFDRDLLSAKRRQRIGEAISKAPQHLAAVSELRSGAGGADWIHANTRPLLIKGRSLCDQVVDVVERMIRARYGEISTQRLATEEEVENLEAIEGRTFQRPHYISKQIGSLRGLAALYPENDLRQLLVIDLGERLKELQRLDVDTMRDTELAKWDKWAAQVDGMLEQARFAVQDGASLLRKDNVAQLLAVMARQSDRDALSRFVSKLPK
jgi:hypothetical protein